MQNQRDDKQGSSQDGLRKDDILAALSKINHAIANSSELKPVLSLILENAVKILKIDTAKLYLIDKKDNLLKGVACAGSRDVQAPIEMEQHTELPFEEGEATLQIPLIVGNIKIGLLIADNSRSRRRITKEEKEMLDIFSYQALAAIEKLKLSDHIKYVSVRDDLTGSFVHNFFLSLVEAEAKRSAREKKNFSVMVIDIDGLHRYNDLYGRQSGDEMIVALSKIINKNIRSFDVTGRPVNSVSRNTGDELEVLLVNSTPKNALAAAYRISKAVKASEFKFADKLVNFSVSTGIAVYPQDGTTQHQLFKRAEEALCWAKQHGKDQVCLVKDIR
jgi:diguanylate cyclase (GGDEF)-like protein